LQAGDGSGLPALKGHRQVFFRDTGFIECPCYERKKMRAGDALRGPLIVEASDSTTVVPGGWDVLCDDTGNLFVTKEKRS
jgi:N-methylhydantoinase A